MTTNTSGHSSLLKSPTNLKEAIDWILRVTNKDGQQGGQDAENHCWCDLANGVTDLLEGVENHLDPEEKKIVQNIIDVLYDVGGTKHVKALIEKVASQLAKFIGYQETSNSGGGGGIGKGGIGCCGKSGSNGGSGPCPCGSNKKGKCKGKKYESKYTQSDKFDESLGGGDDSDDDTTNNKVREAKLRCAKILLGCIPFVFSGLSYMAWISKQSSDNNYKVSLRHYVERMGYKWDQWRCKSNQEVELDLLSEVFDSSEVFGAEADKGKNYAQYLEKLREKAEKEKDTKDKLPLIILNTICSGYFRSLHTIDSIRSNKPRLPRTVREILYWLTSLPYCPIYRTLVPKVQEMFRRVGTGDKGEVVFYGSNWSGQGKELKVSDTNCAYYLLGAALVAPMVLLTIQDTVECLVGKDEKQPKLPQGEFLGDERIVFEVISK
ncbi:variant erythrocyte surface antigen beta subunit, putative [Babesia ovis]|uniref:Variant erythrocyte surface antigen beta subunit, putative n=1 Tax=Babesia ovis TaxID=5869 RepID=A0A9W5WTH5_BABOV|nr:variant erythrocyte surface antigen beta subunit, putative [Babesia ovis]